jgi:hypothetical protein
VVHRHGREEDEARAVDDVGGVEAAAQAGLEQEPVGPRRLAKARKAAAVVISKKVIGCPALARSQASSAAARCRSGIGSPPSRIRSLKRTRWGEM